MPRAIVIAADLLRELFVLENESGQCGVFWVLTGPTIFAGDIMDGDVTCRGRCRFIHAHGMCWARGGGEALTRAEALLVLERSTLKVTGHQSHPQGWDPLTTQGGQRIKSRLLVYVASTLGRGVQR